MDELKETNIGALLFDIILIDYSAKRSIEAGPSSLLPAVSRPQRKP
jgi:hypothetical protein